MISGDAPLSAVLDVAVDGLASILDHEYCKVLELLPGDTEVKLVSGVGWKPGLVGSATVGTGQDSQAGYTLRAGAPVVVTDLRTETRFWGPPLLREHGVISGISAVIPARKGAWGVLGVHATTRRDYDDDDGPFVATVAAVLGAAVAAREFEAQGSGSREQAVRALRREETRSAELRAVIAAMGAGVLVFDEQDRLLLMNEAAQVILDGSDIGTLGDLAAIASLPLDGSHEHAVMERPMGATDRWLEISLNPVEAPTTTPARETGRHENRASTLVVIRDITDARATREARDAFVGMLSHELRTPITIIYGGAEILAREPDHARRSEIAADVRAEADRLRRVVENVLVLTRVERSALALLREPVSLSRLVPTIVAAEQAQWPEHAMRSTAPGGVPTVGADATYVEQVLRNVLSNAAKFSPPGSPIEVRVEPDADGARVTVIDRGPGFPPDEHDRLFTLFYRSDAARMTAGSGIGLFVSRKLVELMGGRMWAESIAGGGASFSFWLPPYRDEDDL